MAVPDFQSFFKPLLEFAADGEEHSVREARERLVDAFEMTDEDFAELLPSGRETRYANRISWAKTYFVHAGVFSSPGRGIFQITDRGRELLEQKHNRIDTRILSQYPEFMRYYAPSEKTKGDTKDSEVVPKESSTPEEILQESYESLRKDLAVELLTNVKDNTPEFFEQLVVDLMVAMGYGGSRDGDLVGKSRERERHATRCIMTQSQGPPLNCSLAVKSTTIK